MIARILSRPLRGVVRAVPSKSEAHRALICASLADRPTLLRISGTSEDIEATARCLRAFGAEISAEAEGLRVTPIQKPTKVCNTDCGESGSTLRFLLPVAAALGIHARFQMRGRLPQRPLFPLDRVLERGGCVLNRLKSDVIEISGQLHSGAYSLPGDVSSQYISGMLLALSLLEGESTLSIEGRIESVGYVRMTLECLRKFGTNIKQTEFGYRISGRGRFISPKEIRIGGDWSNAAFWFCADRMPECGIRVEGLDADSAQGDRRIIEILDAIWQQNGLESSNSFQEELVIDAADIPDLVPPLAAAASISGRTVCVQNAARLRLKESDRLHTISAVLNALGGDVTETDDGLYVKPIQQYHGGVADCAGDHRIAMMAAIASAACDGTILLRGAEAIGKSYPTFWNDFINLGGDVEFIRTSI